MYKVFVRDKVILLCDSIKAASLTDKFPLVAYRKDKIVINTIKRLEKEAISGVVICHENEDELWKGFQRELKVITAAGGLVRNQNNQYLLIFRNGKWDLPKGKAEPGETIEQTALREVEEECGVSDLKIIRKLPETYHIYELKGRPVLKTSCWFEMATRYTGSLTPQAEEGITAVKWMSVAEIKEAMNNTFSSIRELMKEAGIV